MKQLLLCFSALSFLASCTAARDDSRAKGGSSAPVAHNTVVECVLYDGMTKESQQLTTITSGNEVQVMDTVNDYFVKVRITADGKTQNGYMYRTCFGK